MAVGSYFDVLLLSISALGDSKAVTVEDDDEETKRRQQRTSNAEGL